MNPRTNKAMENKFNRKLQQLLMKKTNNKLSMTKQEYSLMIKKVTAAKETRPRWRTPDQSKYLEKFDVLEVGRTKKLVAPKRTKRENPRYFVHTKELFNILHQLHLRMKHGSVNRMHNKLKLKYKNITREIIRIYVKLCARCVKKAKKPNPDISKDKVVPKKHLTRGQIECMKMYPCGWLPVYQNLMMYHDHVTKYDVARPLVKGRVDKIAEALSAIFTLFGTPDVLQTMMEGNFVKEVVQQLRIKRPRIKIEPEEIKLEETWNTVEPGVWIPRDPNLLNVGNIFTSWRYEIANRLQRKLSDVVEGRLCQRPRDKHSPYNGMFVRNLKLSPRWSHLSGFILDQIKAQKLNQNRRNYIRPL